MEINLISFTVPYPPDYGGVIDVFYKIMALSKIGVEVHLHCFIYDRKEADILEKYCKSVTYYKRKTGFLSNLSVLPYIVKSRVSEQLVKNLQQNDYPILFEGLHSSYYLSDKRFLDRIKIVRSHNIEHEYYENLAKVEKNILKKLFFLIESFKLKFFERNFKYANSIYAISYKDSDYLKSKYGNVHYIPAFHGNTLFLAKEGRGDYILYHGNLSVGENENAVIYLITKVFSHIDYPVIIAGKKPSSLILTTAMKYENIMVLESPEQAEMQEIIKNAHIHVLFTFQATGMKLKLLNSLFLGRYCIVNNEMLAGTDLEKLCSIANTPEDFIFEIKKLWGNPFTSEILNKRKELLVNQFNDELNARKLSSCFLKEQVVI